jgi:hypothetical protein
LNERAKIIGPLCDVCMMILSSTEKDTELTTEKEYPTILPVNSAQAKAPLYRPHKYSLKGGGIFVSHMVWRRYLTLIYGNDSS